MIAPITTEEAPARFVDWLGQRTRWMKGHAQTWLVLNRNPFKAIGEMGLGAFLAAQITLGASLLASAVHAPLMIWLLLGLLTPYVSLDGWYAALFGLGYGSVVAAAFAARLPGRSLSALLLLPFYWPIVTLAMICAMWDLKARPHFWAKTPHGVGRQAG
jgi:glycosyltransferase XagB